MINNIGDTMIIADNPANNVADQFICRVSYIGPSNSGNVADTRLRTIT